MVLQKTNDMFLCRDKEIERDRKKERRRERERERERERDRERDNKRDRVRGRTRNEQDVNRINIQEQGKPARFDSCACVSVNRSDLGATRVQEHAPSLLSF